MIKRRIVRICYPINIIAEVGIVTIPEFVTSFRLLTLVF